MNINEVVAIMQGYMPDESPKDLMKIAQELLKMYPEMNEALLNEVMPMVVQELGASAVPDADARMQALEGMRRS